MIRIPNKTNWARPSQLLRTTGVEEHGPKVFISLGLGALKLWGPDLAYTVGVAKLHTWPPVYAGFKPLRDFEDRYFNQTFIVERRALYCKEMFEHWSYRRRKRVFAQVNTLPFLRIKTTGNGSYWYYKINYKRMWRFESDRGWEISAPLPIARKLDL